MVNESKPWRFSAYLLVLSKSETTKTVLCFGLSAFQIEGSPNRQNFSPGMKWGYPENYNIKSVNRIQI